MERQEAVKSADMLFMSITADKGPAALLGRTGTGSVLFYKQEAEQAVTDILPQPSAWQIQLLSS